MAGPSGCPRGAPDLSLLLAHALAQEAEHLAPAGHRHEARARGIEQLERAQQALALLVLLLLHQLTRRVQELVHHLGGGKGSLLDFGAAGGELLRPRQTSERLSWRYWVRRSGLSLQTVQGGSWGAVLRQDGRPLSSGRTTTASSTDIRKKYPRYTIGPKYLPRRRVGQGVSTSAVLRWPRRRPRRPWPSCCRSAPCRLGRA